jgi:hypothetical protein
MTIIDSHVSFNNITAQEFADGDGAAIAAKISIAASPALEMNLGRLMKTTGKVWDDLAAFVRHGDHVSSMTVYRTLNDLSLTIAARPATNWREAKRKVILLAEHRHAVRLREPTFVAILDAVIEQECEKWNIFLVETFQQKSAATKH